MYSVEKTRQVLYHNNILLLRLICTCRNEAKKGADYTQIVSFFVFLPNNTFLTSSKLKLVAARIATIRFHRRRNYLCSEFGVSLLPAFLTNFYL